MAVMNNLKTYEPFADMVRGSPMFDQDSPPSLDL